MQTQDKFHGGKDQAREKKDPGILSVTVFGGAIAALCCLIVPALVSLSSTSAVLGSLDAFASLRPYLIAGAWVLALLAVLFVVYRRLKLRGPRCEPGDACESTESKSGTPSAR